MTLDLRNSERWTAAARCRDFEPEIFFLDPRADSREAVRVCAGCPVRAQCLEFAVRTDQRFGIWGGLSELDRRALKRGGAPPRRVWSSPVVRRSVRTRQRLRLARSLSGGAR